MAKKENVHIVHDKEEGVWKAKKANSDRASFTGNTQQEVFEKARDQSKREGNTEISIHGKDGKIREKNTYNRKDDPHKTKG